MYQSYLIEFSKLYKRLMELECCLKHRIISTLAVNYSDKCYLKLQHFFVQYCQPQDKYKNLNPNFYAIGLDPKLTNEEKLTKSINSLYLSDLLKILTEQKVFYKDNKLVHTLYGHKPEMNTLKAHCSGISLLRNSIAHCKYEEYDKNRKKCLKSLKYFEIIMHCTMGAIHKLPTLSHKPPIKDILQTLYSYNETLFRNDRLLCDLFDDLAVLNGHSYNKLPAYWSILRLKYQIEGQKPSKEAIERDKRIEIEEISGQIKLF